MITRLSAPVGAVEAGTVMGAGGGGAALTAGAGGWPSWPDEAPARGRRRRRRLAVLVFSAATMGATSTGGGPGSTGLAVTGDRRPRRLRDAGAAWAPSTVWAGWAGWTGWAGWGRAAWALRRTLAPTSPSAHNAPSAVWTSTRQTTMAVGAPPTGGRFWVRVQRAYMVSPARTGRGNFQFSHSHSATEGTGMSMVPRPIATATRRAGGAKRAPA